MNTEAAATLVDSPRAYESTRALKIRTHAPKKDASADALVGSFTRLRTTLNAQEQAGKTDSASEIHGGMIKKPVSPIHPKTPIAPPRIKARDLTVEQLNALSDADFDDLSFSSSDDEETHNIGFDEWGSTPSASEASTPTHRTSARAKTAALDKADQTVDDAFLSRWNEWGNVDSDSDNEG